MFDRGKKNKKVKTRLFHGSIETTNAERSRTANLEMEYLRSGLTIAWVADDAAQLNDWTTPELNHIYIRVSKTFKISISTLSSCWIIVYQILFLL